jgi:hypothetical protein
MGGKRQVASTASGGDFYSTRNGSDGWTGSAPPIVDAAEAVKNCCRMPIVSLKMLLTSAAAHTPV